ncbi:MAG TPA: hypothetical protein VFZ53_21760 [Polyangiaceae bacterium]
MLRFTTALLTTLSLAAGLSGCAENESSLFIEGVLSLPASDCVARPDAEAEFIPQGVLDVHFAEGYVAAVQVGNQLTQQGNREKLRTETSRLHLEGATGTVFDVDGGEHEFEAIATGFAHPAAGTEAGLAAMFVNLINGETMDAVAAAGPGDIVVRFRVFGTTLGGKEIESGDYDYPIFLCDGCLVNYPADALQSGLAPGEPYLCGAAADSGQEEKICFYGQDQRFSCSACATVDPICRDPTLNPWN